MAAIIDYSLKQNLIKPAPHFKTKEQVFHFYSVVSVLIELECKSRLICFVFKELLWLPSSTVTKEI
ncbi:hypothetical protein [Aquibacillus albus]|uniref:Uncharacterized protein n=1 Tax=Aquibacillus albus TaxID=1168171 RepID=A0ABS2N448_9BACI|nr:hypothetical protein [Aquibacillus albus]MBM7572897.1 hypothetical protein [Aquibacillus albus]